jgi:hypothetical protein
MCPTYCSHFSACKKRGRSREEDEELGFRRERNESTSSIGGRMRL